MWWCIGFSYLFYSAFISNHAVFTGNANAFFRVMEGAIGGNCNPSDAWNFYDKTRGELFLSEDADSPGWKDRGIFSGKSRFDLWKQTGRDGGSSCPTSSALPILWKKEECASMK